MNFVLYLLATYSKMQIEYYYNLLEYDYSNILKINDIYYIPGAETNIARGSYWSNVTPVLLYGESLDALSIVRYNDPITFYESVTWARFNNQNYILYSSFGNSNVYYFDINLSYGGKLLTSDPITNGRIPGFDFVTRTINGVTTYYLLSFSPTELTLTDVNGVQTYFEWSMGETIVYKSNQTAQGAEF